MNISESNVLISYPIKTLLPDPLSGDNGPNIQVSVNETQVNEIWTKSNFSNRQNLTLDLDNTKMSWSCQEKMKEEFDDGEHKEESFEVELKSPTTPDQEMSTSPSHHARRPMNAFLIFCKKHRPIVRRKYPNLENRGVTRILGEWWALLDSNDKDAYTNLAKEYKDAFFSANPNFKWYKLPAPPLRTLPIRPSSIKQESSPPLSPTNLSSPSAEFTPGKLADESQLGMLSSLLNTSYNYSSKANETCTKRSPTCTDIIETTLCNNNNQTENNNEDYTLSFQSPVSLNQNNKLPPKPIKKRYSECYNDNKIISRNIFEMNADISEQNMTTETNVNMTNQQIVNKVIDSQFLDEVDMKNGYKDTRKSGRKGKGNRYAEFMANGKLLKNKRDKRDTTSISLDTPKFDLNHTIKRLEERIQPKFVEENIKQESTRTISETSDVEDYSKSIPSFNLDQRISELPTLSYETYVQRKKESKKRKFVRNKPENKPKIEVALNKIKHLTGSKKRKNKHNITHLEKNDNFVGNTFENNDLSGLATLAEIAAIKEKIDST